MNIVFACNNTYAPFCGVAIQSLIENTLKNNHVKIHILHNELNDYHLNLLQQTVLYHNNFSIEMYNIDQYVDFDTSNVYFNRKRITKETYFRLFLGDIFLKCEKILYLDCDIIVSHDLSILYNTDIDQYYLAAVKDYGFQRQQYLSYHNNILHTDIHNYFNGGVLLCNLKKWRDDDMTKKFLDSLSCIEKPRWMDQCILNASLNKNCYFLQPIYNYMLHVNYEKVENEYRDYELPISIQDINIIHYTGGYKPWDHLSDVDKNIFVTIFWSYLKKSIYYEYILYKYIKNSNIDLNFFRMILITFKLYNFNKNIICTTNNIYANYLQLYLNNNNDNRIHYEIMIKNNKIYYGLHCENNQYIEKLYQLFRTFSECYNMQLTKTASALLVEKETTHINVLYDLKKFVDNTIDDVYLTLNIDTNLFNI